MALTTFQCHVGRYIMLRSDGYIIIYCALHGSDVTNVHRHPRGEAGEDRVDLCAIDLFLFFSFLFFSVFVGIRTSSSSISVVVDGNYIPNNAGGDDYYYCAYNKKLVAARPGRRAPWERTTIGIGYAQLSYTYNTRRRSMYTRLYAVIW